MSVGQICVRGVVSATKEESVYAVAGRMRDRKVSSLVILDDTTTPIGIVTDRDLTVRVLAEGRDPHVTIIEEIIPERVTALDVEMSLQRALEVMRSGPFRRLPVTDGAGRLVGLLNIDDILEELASEFHLEGSMRTDWVHNS